MTFKIITTQPDIYNSFLKTGLIARGISKKFINVEINNLHDFAFDKHRSIDDTPYGGGAGMVLRVDVMAEAIAKVKGNEPETKSKVVLLTPQGRRFNQEKAREFAELDNLIIIAGRFEGYDERIRNLVDEEISLGDFVLTSGDIPAMSIIDATSRMVKGFIDKEESIKEESFSEFKIDNLKFKNLLEYPQYTRPETFDGEKVPEILLSGNHEEIKKWRLAEAQKRTRQKRPDLFN